jgi:hypothetical protein
MERNRTMKRTAILASAAMTLASLAMVATPRTASAQANPAFAIHGQYLLLPVAAAPSADASSSSAPDALPEAPSAVLLAQQEKPLVAGTPAESTRTENKPIAPAHWKYIPADYTAQKITNKDKVEIGFRDLYSAGDFASIFIAAGYEQLTNTQPHYGTDRGAFGERLGAAGAREASEGIFTDVVFSPLFHEDPRYFEEGESYGFVHRVVYAVTRVVLTKNNDGDSVPNAALLAGYAASTALTISYYPSVDRKGGYPVETYFGALGGAALGFVVDEFSDQVLRAIHLEKKP